ncbi:MAG: hypothetical protein ABIN04_15245 [Ginsengibacter sp.]
MIENFYEYTHDLTEYELSLVPKFVAGFAGKNGKENAITNDTIIARLKERGVTVSSARVRKLINHIRNRGLIDGLLASSRGYFVSTDEEEINKYILSLQSREDAIRVVKEGFEAYLRRLKK